MQGTWAGRLGVRGDHTPTLAGGSSHHRHERQQEEQGEGRQLLQVVGRWHPRGEHHSEAQRGHNS